jgi:hypothetical protein
MPKEEMMNRIFKLSDMQFDVANGLHIEQLYQNFATNPQGASARLWLVMKSGETWMQTMEIRQ